MGIFLNSHGSNEAFDVMCPGKIRRRASRLRFAVFVEARSAFE